MTWCKIDAALLNLNFVISSWDQENTSLIGFLIELDGVDPRNNDSILSSLRDK